MARNMVKSFITKMEISHGDEVLINDFRPGILQLLREQYPKISKEKYRSPDELNVYRRRNLAQLVDLEKGELAVIDQDVRNAIRDNSLLSENVQIELDKPLSFGQRMADRIATFGGSLRFLGAFLIFLFIWILFNSLWFLFQPFDPYPFILLNLILSCLAAVQAPIIMMSQNRQEEKDRIRAEHDYKIHLKAELEIKLLSEIMDHLLIHQNKKLLEIQEVQVDYLKHLLKQIKKHEA